jgi:DNA-binding IclR family transcriptional regulator
MSEKWTFLTNHGHVLLELYRDPELRQRDIAQRVGITEGAVQRILTDLEASGYLAVERIGRRNRYECHLGLGLRHPVEAGHTVGELLKALSPSTPTEVRCSRAS